MSEDEIGRIRDVAQGLRTDSTQRRDGRSHCGLGCIGTPGCRYALPAARGRRPPDLRGDVDRRPHDLCPPRRSLRRAAAGRRLQADAGRPHGRLAQHGPGLCRLSRRQRNQCEDPLLADGAGSLRRRDRGGQRADRRCLARPEGPLRSDRKPGSRGSSPTSIPMRSTPMAAPPSRSAAMPVRTPPARSPKAAISASPRCSTSTCRFRARASSRS